MSRFDLRDISERLSRSADVEAVVFEFLGALKKAHPDWSATLSFYEVSRDSLVRLYERKNDQLVSRDILVAVDQLPPRMIRGFFHPNASFEPQGRQSILTPFVHASPVFVPDMNDAVLLRALLPVANWASCASVALSDQDEVLAVLVLVSERRTAFGPREIEELLPLRDMAATALVQRLHRAPREAAHRDEREAGEAAGDIQSRIEQLSIHARELEEDLAGRSGEVDSLSRRIEELDQDSSGYRAELQRVKGALLEMEERSTRASRDLSEASVHLDAAEARIHELHGTNQFLLDAFEVLAGEHDPRQFPAQIMSWISGRLEIGRCSVMLVDRSGHIMRIAYHTGLDPAIAEKVRVRVGQGVAGWVALNRKPLLVRLPEDAPEVERVRPDDYNSSSFVCVPIVYNGRVAGVLNFSNRKDGKAFNSSDLDRAQLAAGLFAITLGANEVVRRALAWAA